MKLLLLISAIIAVVKTETLDEAKEKLKEEYTTSGTGGPDNNRPPPGIKRELT